MATAPARTATDPAQEAWQLCMELFAAGRPRMLDIQAEFGLKPPQFFALNALDEPLPMSSIGDRRVKLLALTDEGRRVRDELRARMARPPEAISGLSPADQRALRDLLRKALSD